MLEPNPSIDDLDGSLGVHHWALEVFEIATTIRNHVEATGFDYVPAELADELEDLWYKLSSLKDQHIA